MLLKHKVRVVLCGNQMTAAAARRADMLSTHLLPPLRTHSPTVRHCTYKLTTGAAIVRHLLHVRCCIRCCAYAFISGFRSVLQLTAVALSLLSYFKKRLGWPCLTTATLKLAVFLSEVNICS